MTIQTRALPPSANGRLPLLGHAWAFLRDPLGFLASLRDRGEVVTLQLGSKTVYAVCSPALVAELLVDKAHSSEVGGRLWEAMADLLGEGVAVSRGAAHRRQRRTMQPAFTTARVATYAPIMHEEIDTLVGTWRPGQVVDLTQAMNDLAVRITVRSLLQGDAVTGRTAEFTDALDTLFVRMYRRMILAASPFPSLTHGRAFARALATVHGIVDDAIAERRASDTRHHDLLTELTNATDDDGAPLTHREIHDHVLAVLVAGAETVSSGMCSALQLLAHHPEVAERVHRELDAAGGHRTRPVDPSALPLLGAVVTESLRVAPPAWMFTRRVTADLDLGGYRIPRDADVFYTIYGLHHDRRSFPQPDQFDPDRWLDARADGVPRHALIPFGLGNRKCPGDNFAVAQMTLTLVGILRRWRLVATAPPPKRPRLGMTLRPRQLHLRVEPAGRPIGRPVATPPLAKARQIRRKDHR